MQAWGHSGSGALRHAVFYHAGGEKFPTLACWLSRCAWTQPWAALLAPSSFVPKVHPLWGPSFGTSSRCTHFSHSIRARTGARRENT